MSRRLQADPLYKSVTRDHCRLIGCRRPASNIAQVCDEHLEELGVIFMSRRSILSPDFRADQRAERRAEKAERDRLHAEATAAQSQVYYLRIGDHVKIGYTSNLTRRLQELRLHPSAVLAAEPGGQQLERQRHLLFAAERAGRRREDFNPSPKLLAHIERLRAEHGDPLLASHRTAATENA
jgi:hypothetical protein